MPGTITFRPIEANITGKDQDVVGKMDPYLSFHIGHHHVKTQVCKEGGEHPVWSDEIIVDVPHQSSITVDLKDKDTLIDEKIGTFEVDLQELESKGQLKKWYPIFHKSVPRGEVLLEAVYHGGNIGAGRQDFEQEVTHPSKNIIPTQNLAVSNTGIPLTVSQPFSSEEFAREAIIKGVDPYGSANISSGISQVPVENFSQPITTQIIKTELPGEQRVDYHNEEPVFIGQGQFINRSKQMPFGHGHHLPDDPKNPMYYH